MRQPSISIHFKKSYNITDEKMNKKYLINEHVIFDSDANCLFSVSSPSVKVSLHTPASQCLLLLVQNKGEVLNQKFLFENIWGKNGAFVSANALYQNIAIVRKCLKSAGIEQDIVQTIPKIGIKFTGEAVLYEPVLSLANEPEPAPAEVITSEKMDDEPMASLPAPPASAKNEQNPEPITDSAIATDLPAAVTVPKSGRITIKPTYWCLAALVFGALCAMAYLQQKPENSFFSDYKLIGKVNGCTLISSYYNKEVATQAFTDFSKVAGLICANNMYAYLTINRLPEGTTIMLCDQRAENTNAQCLSYIFLDPTNDKN